MGKNDISTFSGLMRFPCLFVSCESTECDISMETLWRNKLLRQCSVHLSTEQSMNFDDLEREQDITITSKVTTLQLNNLLLDIVDSPEHSNFGGEVECIVSMVDSAVLLVDATKQQIVQIKTILAEALFLNLRPSIALNKIDRLSALPQQAAIETLDLIVALDATVEQLDFAAVYAFKRREGRACDTLEGIAHVQNNSSFEEKTSFSEELASPP